MINIQYSEIAGFPTLHLASFIALILKLSCFKLACHDKRMLARRKETIVVKNLWRINVNVSLVVE